MNPVCDEVPSGPRRTFEQNVGKHVNTLDRSGVFEHPRLTMGEAGHATNDEEYRAEGVLGLLNRWACGGEVGGVWELVGKTGGTCPNGLAAECKRGVRDGTEVIVGLRIADDYVALARELEHVGAERGEVA